MICLHHSGNDQMFLQILRVRRKEGEEGWARGDEVKNKQTKNNEN